MLCIIFLDRLLLIYLFSAIVIGGFPYIDETSRWMKPVEQCQRKGGVTQKRPQRMAVKVDAIAISLVWLDLKRFDDPQGDVADDEECYQLATRFAFLQLDAVTATAQSVDDERRLYNYLHHLRKFIVL